MQNCGRYKIELSYNIPISYSSNIAGLAVLLYTASYTGLQIEEPQSAIIIGNEYDAPKIEFKVRSYEEKKWEQLNGTLKIDNHSSKFVKILTTHLDSHQLGKDATRSLSINPLRILDSEGSKITYESDIVLNDKK